MTLKISGCKERHNCISNHINHDEVQENLCNTSLYFLISNLEDLSLLQYTSRGIKHSLLLKIYDFGLGFRSCVKHIRSDWYFSTVLASSSSHFEITCGSCQVGYALSFVPFYTHVCTCTADSSSNKIHHTL